MKFPGIIKHEHVYNDYHKMEANPGYSRNYLGKFYTKWMIESLFNNLIWYILSNLYI